VIVAGKLDVYGRDDYLCSSSVYRESVQIKAHAAYVRARRAWASLDDSLRHTAISSNALSHRALRAYRAAGAPFLRTSFALLFLLRIARGTYLFPSSAAYLYRTTIARTRLFAALRAACAPVLFLLHFTARQPLCAASFIKALAHARGAAWRKRQARLLALLSLANIEKIKINRQIDARASWQRRRQSAWWMITVQMATWKMAYGCMADVAWR